MKEGLVEFVQSKSKTFLVFCFCFLVGVFLASILGLQSGFIYFYLSLFVLAAFLVYFWHNKVVVFFVLCVMCFVIGVARYVFAFPSTPPQEGEQTFIGTVVSEPDVRVDSVNYVILNHKSSILNLVQSTLYPRYNYGDKLQVSCKLKKPYGMYALKQGTFLSCDRPQITKVGPSSAKASAGEGGNFFMAKILDLKYLVAKQVNKLWHEPQASFMAGLLYGYRGGLGDLNDLFSRTGVTHIVAISGYNISIIATILITICTQLYIPRQKSFWLVSTGIILFVIFTGASASVVRAGIMGIIVLTAKQVGRMSEIGRVLVFVAVLMCLQNPLVLVWDAGFQLSFISTMGLIYLSPILELSLRGAERRGNPVCVWLANRESLVCTLSAIIATLPLILYQFGRLSIVAPIVNILILWTIPYIMLVGFVAVIISFIFFPIGQLIAWLGLLGLNYIIIIVKWFGSLSFASLDLTIPVWLMFGLYIGMICVVYKQNKQSRQSK